MATRIRPIEQVSRTDLLVQDLRRVAAEVGAGGRLPPARELCRLYRVSNSTLGKALARLEEEGLVSRRHGRGVYIEAEATHRQIAYVTDRDSLASSYYFDALAEHSRTVSSSHAFRLKFYVDGEDAQFFDPAALRIDLREERIDGVLWMAGSLGTLRMIESRGVPVVCRYPGVLGEWMVAQDMEAVVRDGVEALMRAGCERIGLLANREIQPEGHRRFATTPSVFAEAMARCGRPLDERRVRVLYPAQGDNFGAGERAVEEILAAGAFDCDGLVFNDDVIARGALHALSRGGIRIGTDCRVATLANTGSPTLREYEDRIVRLEFDPLVQVRTMLDHLEMLMRDEEPPEAFATIAPALIEPEAVSF